MGGGGGANTLRDKQVDVRGRAGETRFLCALSVNLPKGNTSDNKME